MPRLLLLASCLIAVTAYGQNDCLELPEEIQLVADNITIDAEDLASFVLDPLLNDSLPTLLYDYVEVGYEHLPIEVDGCFLSTYNFDTYQGFLLTGDESDTSDCCGIFQIPYSVITYGPWWEGCLLTDTITVNVTCEEKGDCSWIDLAAAAASEDSTCIPVCEGTVTSITAPFNPLNTYSWEVNGGAVIGTLDNAASVEVQWDAPGPGLVVLHIESDNGGSSSLAQCVDIRATPMPSFSSVDAACLNVPVAFQSQSDNGAAHFWDFGDGTTSTEINPVHTFNTSGPQTVSLTTTAPLLDEEGNALCCCSREVSQELDILDLVGPSIECRSTLCEGDSACYWTNDGCAGASYMWSVSDAAGNPVNFSGQGTAEICVQWGEGPAGEVSLLLDGCGNACPEPTTVIVPIVSSTSTIAGPEVACQGDVVTYSVPKWMDVQYTWTVSGALSVTPQGNQVTVQWGNGNAGEVAVQYFSPFLSSLPNQEPDACFGTGNLAVSIRPELNFTSTHEQACVGASIGFTTNVNDVAWSTSSNSDVGTGGFFVTAFDSDGPHAVTATALDPSAYCNASVTHTVQVSSLPTIQIAGPEAGCAETEFIYSLDPLPPGTSVFWSSNGGSTGTGFGSGFANTWTAGAANPGLQATISQDNAPGCATQAQLSFVEWTPATPVSIDHTDACANQLDTFALALSQPGVGETLTWSILPESAGSVVGGQGTDLVVIQWNDVAGGVTLSVVSDICGLETSGTFTVEVHPTPALAVIQNGDLCNGALLPATLSTAPTYADVVWTLPDVYVDNDSLVTNATSTDAILDSLLVGTYTATVTDVWGCVNSATFDVVPTPGPDAGIHALVNLPICTSSSTDLALLATASQDWSHEWSTGSTSASAQHVVAGVPTTISLVTTDVNTGCYTTTSRSVEVDCSGGGGSGGGGGGGGGTGCTPSESLNPSATTCAQVSASVNCTNCTNVQWNFGDGTGTSVASTHNYTEAGCYDITAFGQVPSTTPGETCTIQESVYACIPLASNFTTTRLTCTEYQFEEVATWLDIPGEDNDIIQWSWAFGDGGESSDPNPTHDFGTQGVFVVSLTVTSLNGCTAEHTVTLDLNYAPVIEVDLDAPICQGTPGLYAASATGAQSFAWSIPNGVAFAGQEFYHTFESLPTGNEVEVTVTSAPGCVASSLFPLIVHPLAADPLAGLSDEILCSDPGFIDLASAAGFVDHQWYNAGAPISGASSGVFTAGAGTFHVEATDANGCPVTSSEVQIQVRPDPQPFIVGPHLVCGNDIPVSFSVNGNYVSHTWYEGNNVQGANSTLDVSPFGYPTLEFQAVVVDADNCTHTSPVHTVQWEPIPEINLSSPMFPPCTQDAFPIAVNNPPSDMEFYWTHGDQGASIEVDQAGVYSVVGIAASGCVANATFEVLPLPDLCSVPAGCYETCSPTAVCSPDGLAAYQWSLNGSAVPGGFNVCADFTSSGVVQLLATDALGCSAVSAPLDLTVQECGCVVDAALTPDEDCCVSLDFDNASTVTLTTLLVQTDGDTATLTSNLNANVIDQGVDFIEVSFPAGEGLPLGDHSAALTLCFADPGPHQVIWQWTHDGGGTCSDTLDFIQPSATHEVVGETCPGFCDGTIVSTVISDADWTAALTDADGTIQDGSAACPGTYFHVLTDGGACAIVDTLEVEGPAPFQLEVNAAPAPCFGDNGTLCVALLEGGSGPLTINVQPTADAINDSCFAVPAGDHQVFLSDSLGCLSSPVEFTIEQPLPIQSFIGIDPITCFGAQDGAIVIDALGGTGSLSLASPYVLPSLPDTLFNLGGGDFEMVVTDSLGCVDTTLAILLEPDPVSLTLQTLEGVSCYGECTGVATFDATGGTGALAYHMGYISDSTDVTPLDFQSLCAGAQTVFLSDANGCVDSVAFEVATSPALEFNIATEDITCTGMTDGAFQISLSGGSGNVGWVILGDAVDQEAMAEGVYFLEGFDDVGCTVDSSFEIGAEIVSDMVLSLFSTPVSCWQTDDGTATAAVTGGALPLVYQWNDPDAQSVATAIGLQQDQYDVVVTDQIGCTLSGTVAVEGNEDCLFIADAITPNGDGINDVWVVGGLEFFPLSTVRVFNRWGQVVFDSAPWSTLWDGRFNGNLLPAGDYYYVITPVPGSAPITGTVSLKY